MSQAVPRTELVGAVHAVREPLDVIEEDGQRKVARGADPRDPRWVGRVPALYPEWLGDRGFTHVHGVRFPYVVGEMANGIATVAMVTAAARAGLLGFFGAAGLAPDAVERALDELAPLDGRGLSWGSNLIHSPQDPALEQRIVDLYLARGVRRVSASAFMALTPPVVEYACRGVRVDAAGRIVRQNHVFAKISRVEVARQFASPPPPAILEALRGRLSEGEIELARRLPVAEDVTVESDSGGHTDNRPLAALFPVVAGVCHDLALAHGRPIRVGAAGGLGTPAAVAAAFGLGAAYVLTGSVNQAAIESGLSDAGKEMLARAGLADVVMAPAADMFELGVEVQVLRRGTFFAQRGARLHELYQQHDGLASIPAAEIERLERDVFRRPIAQVWDETVAYFRAAAPAEIDRAERDPKHRMALVFRWYLGQSSHWAVKGVAERALDFQIWCGPAMGAFNAWVAGSFLEARERRTVVQIARNLLEGAAAITRAQQLRAHGVPVPEAAFRFAPRPLEN